MPTYEHPKKNHKAPVVKLKDTGSSLMPKKAKINCACSGTKDARVNRPGR
jgi:hypothetical protein